LETPSKGGVFFMTTNLLHPIDEASLVLFRKKIFQI